MDTRQKEMGQISRLLKQLGFDLEKDQPHIEGERVLSSPDKLVLVGKNLKTGSRVIIKMSHLVRAKEEIGQEKKVRDVLSLFPPFKKVILLPKEIYFGQKGRYQILITEYIDQEQVFTSLPLTKQFTTITKAFELRETLSGNIFDDTGKRFIAIPFLEARDYLENFKYFQTSILKNYHTPGMEEAMKEASSFIKNNESLISAYCGYLVHTDFAPHNFRISSGRLYTLDCSAYIFGNKYEEWARLLNYMIIHSPNLEKLLKEFILKSDEKEYLNLRLMRIYKIGYLLQFYAQLLSKTSSELHALTSCRIEFWEEVLRSIMQDKTVDEKVLESYIKNRNNLRSAEEKNRQGEFTIA